MVLKNSLSDKYYLHYDRYSMQVELVVPHCSVWMKDAKDFLYCQTVPDHRIDLAFQELLPDESNYFDVMTDLKLDIVYVVKKELAIKYLMQDENLTFDLFEAQLACLAG
jgi:hypothetical protein